MPLTKPRSALSLTEQLALLENPAPADFDPEALEQEHWDGEGSESDGSESEGEYTGREHYVAVGKSKLRKGHPVLLDPKYNGARVSRSKLYSDDNEGGDSDGNPAEVDKENEEEDERSGDESTGGVGLDNGDDIRVGTPLSGEDDEIDSDDALGSEEERFSGYKFRGSTTITTAKGVANSSGESSGGEDDESDEEEEVEDKEEEEEEEENDTDDGVDGGDEYREEDEDEDESGGEQKEEAARREKLRRMMAEEQRNVVANISKAAKADTDKGMAVRQQQKTFDSFLSVRIKLQKALISTNSLSEAPQELEPWRAAEGAALKLWKVLHNLRCDLTDSRTGTKRKRGGQGDTVETSIDVLWEKMRELDHDASTWREATLDRWSSRTQGAATTSLTKKLNNTVPTPRSLTASIRETLSSEHDRLIARTRIPRSMAPNCTAAEDTEIFDDTDFYQLLLKALVDRRMVDGDAVAGSGAVRWTTAMRDAKKKKIVDTKASKGRKLRYQVQEKIQNFMAPMENNTWHEQQIDELFSSLLGQRVRVDEKDEEVDEEDVEMDGLRLFKS